MPVKIGGRYELLEVAGRGGMATVWRAALCGDRGFRRQVAVKHMHPHLAEQPVFVDMFVEEARVGAELHSPNLAEAFDFVVEQGQYYMIMEWVEGVDLGTYVRYHVERGQQVRWELAAAIGIGVLRALAAAHERRGANDQPAPVVHRDVSPHNVLLTGRGLVKLIDFGLALAGDRIKETTEPGVVKGKMSYLSPEIVAGKRPSPASDQFAVGSLLWETMVGRKLFDGGSDFETYKQVRDARVRPLKPLRPDAPGKLVTLLGRALAQSERERFPSAREMARQLGTVLKSSSGRKDLHTVLAQTVSEARDALGMGHRSGDPSSETPIADLIEDTPEPKKGLRHRLSLFGRKRG